ncbi:MAG: phosphoribosylanthranilate isomerase [Candidatus Melainabacteria bacterium]|nr:phosphoribosylanthranilate isomerase [Candidatus Melainabacteria bacterium]
MLIKICGVRDPQTAFYAAQNGANYVGMILSPGFKRSISIELAKEIAEAARKGGAEPVGVFVKATAPEIEKICMHVGIALVQAYELEGTLSLRRIFINEPAGPNDLLLIESPTPGSGKPIEDFIRPSRPFLIAGGLTPENVRDAIQRFQPNGVDVSSGVERNGSKCPTLIARFIKEARS